ncbi:hypothetical protein EC991_003755 [Linnemannia zychae]|nr:hypothetical protein EC991_003755 [Linnemannia zychae]
MASLEYSQQTSATAAAATAVGGTITIKFTYPVPSANSSTPIPEQVQVTGTFNAWQRSQPLTCNQDRTLFEADIPIDLASLPPQESSSSDKKKQKEDGRKKILFKFVLDGQNWVTDPDQPTERDYAGNVNNVLFINNPLASPPTTTVAVADKDEPASSAPLIVEVKAKTETETEEEKAARLKQEAEDDETIRQLGGGMWGAPFFAVNDPVALPEHFADADDQTSETAKEAKVAPIAVASKEQEKEVEAAVTAISQEVVAEKVQTEIEADVSALQSTQSTTATIGSSSLTLDEPKAEPKVEVVEDEDDKIIKALGGGMWGTPFFKVNDPAELPEHFQEALKHNAATATVSALPSSTSSSAAVENEEKEEVTDKDGSDSRRHSHIQVVKDEVKATVEGGNLIETVVETTEDTVITAADGTFLEESITTTVEDTISGVLEEEVTEVIETIEEEDAPSAAAAIADESGAQVVIEDEGAIEFVETIQEQTDENDTRIPDAGTVTPPEVTMTETETTTSIQGEDGVETTIVEDTLTFTDGPEVDASSLHSLTTAIKPVTEGESVVVEQSPEVLVAVAGFGDAKPSVDESIEAPLPTLSSTTVDTTATPTSEVLEPSTPVPGKVQPLQDVVPLPQDTTPAGDAKPTADLSVATTPVLTPVAVDVKSTLPTHLTPDSKPVALTTVVSETTAVEKSKGKTEKSEKRKSFWKKVKKVLS